MRQVVPCECDSTAQELESRTPTWKTDMEEP